MTDSRHTNRGDPMCPTATFTLSVDESLIRKMWIRKIETSARCQVKMHAVTNERSTLFGLHKAWGRAVSMVGQNMMGKRSHSRQMRAADQYKTQTQSITGQSDQSSTSLKNTKEQKRYYPGPKRPCRATTARSV